MLKGSSVVCLVFVVLHIALPSTFKPLPGLSQGILPNQTQQSLLSLQKANDFFERPPIAPLLFGHQHEPTSSAGQRPSNQETNQEKTQSFLIKPLGWSSLRPYPTLQAWSEELETHKASLTMNSNPLSANSIKQATLKRKLSISQQANRILEHDPILPLLIAASQQYIADAQLLPKVPKGAIGGILNPENYIQAEHFGFELAPEKTTLWLQTFLKKTLDKDPGQVLKLKQLVKDHYHYFYYFFINNPQNPGRPFIGMLFKDIEANKYQNPHLEPEFSKLPSISAYLKSQEKIKGSYLRSFTLYHFLILDPETGVVAGLGLPMKRHVKKWLADTSGKSPFSPEKVLLDASWLEEAPSRFALFKFCEVLAQGAKSNQIALLQKNGPATPITPGHLETLFAQTNELVSSNF